MTNASDYNYTGQDKIQANIRKYMTRTEGRVINNRHLTKLRLLKSLVLQMRDLLGALVLRE